MSDLLAICFPVILSEREHVPAVEYSPRGAQHIEPTRFPGPSEEPVTPAALEVRKRYLAEALAVVEEVVPD